MKKYLFCNDNNGFFKVYYPFECSGSVSQEQAEKLILEVNPAAHRLGSSVSQLLEALDMRNFSVKLYKSIYHKPEENHLRSATGEPTTDPLPDCMYSWPIINGISGNY